MRANPLAILALLLSSFSLQAQPCQPYWSAVGSGTCFGLGTIPFTVKAFNDGSGPALFAVTCNQVRRWDGVAWTDITQGLVRPGYLFIFDQGFGEALYIADRIAGQWVLFRWDGASWHATPPGLVLVDPGVISYGPSLSISHGGGPPILYGAGHDFNTMFALRWNGASWDMIGNTNGSVYLLEHDDGTGPALYAVGSFTTIAGVGAGGVARWDGTEWTGYLDANNRVRLVRAVAAGVIGGVPAIYFMGDAMIGGVLIRERVWRFDGQSLTDIGLPVWYREPHQMFEYNALHISDQGDGPNLYLGGGFAYDTRDIPTRGNIGRWDGAEWHRMGVGLRGVVSSIDSMTVNGTPTLFASGIVWQVGQGLVTGIAQWVGCPNCYANCNSSTHAPAINVEDFICYINRFAALDPYADCNVDGSLNVDDFTCFINHFAAASTGEPSLNCP